MMVSYKAYKQYIDQMLITNENLSGKVILEVGAGRGDTSRKLVDSLAGKVNSRLIVTDISDTFFDQLRDEFRDRNVPIHYLCTGANELKGVDSDSIDYLVCNYTLCAVNSRSGLATLALKRFWQVLRPGGKLFVEEEFPVDHCITPAQEVWAEKWRILRAAMILAKQPTFNELSPEILESLCFLTGFDEITWTAHETLYAGIEVLDFFQKRLNLLMDKLPDQYLRAGFTEMVKQLRNKAAQVGGMVIPYYKLVAHKPEGRG